MPSVYESPTTDTAPSEGLVSHISLSHLFYPVYKFLKPIDRETDFTSLDYISVLVSFVVQLTLGLPQCFMFSCRERERTHLRVKINSKSLSGSNLSNYPLTGETVMRFLLGTEISAVCVTTLLYLAHYRHFSIHH